MMLKEYAAKWLPFVEQTRAPSTSRSYHAALDRHILPTFGNTALDAIRRRDMKAFGADLLGAGLRGNTVKRIVTTLSALLRAALDDELIYTHPGRGIRALGIKESESCDARQALTRDEVRRLLEASNEVTPRYTSLWLTLARTGLRTGEACVLTWDCVDFDQRLVHVRGTLARGRTGQREVGPTKTRRNRSVQMSAGLAAMLLQHRATMDDWTRKTGVVTDYLWPTEAGLPHYPQRIEKYFRRARRAAGLGEHITPKSLRHTFASQLLAETGATPQFVQRQLGHHSISMTVDVYGHWLPTQGSFVDELDEF